MPIPLKGEYWKKIPLNIDLLQPKVEKYTHNIYPMFLVIKLSYNQICLYLPYNGK